MLQEFIDTKAGFYFDKFEKFLSQNGGQYLVGKSLTFADLAVFDALEGACFYLNEKLEKYPLLRAFKSAIENRPNLKAYVTSQERTPFIVNPNLK